MLRCLLASLMILLAAPAYAGSRFRGAFHGGGSTAAAPFMAVSPHSTEVAVAPVLSLLSLADTVAVTIAASVSTVRVTITATAMAAALAMAAARDTPSAPATA